MHGIADHENMAGNMSVHAQRTQNGQIYLVEAQGHVDISNLTVF